MALCITIGLSLPVEVYASTIPEKEKTVYSSFDNVHGETETVGNIVTEISDSRTENTKEFLLDDGTTMIAEYNQPVHYKNDKGKWVEYNNTLVAESSASTADEASDGEYTNKSSNIDVKLSNKAKSNNMIKVTSDDYSISWGYDGTNKSKINILKNDEKLTGNDKFTTLKNITMEAKYENVYKNVDLQYFVTSTGVKENIILKSSDVQNEFNLTYKIKNLTAKQTDDYTITLYNKNNKEVYKIVAPYMTDAKGESSNQLKLELVSQKGGNLQVRLTADYWFIRSIGRSFPITIDPEVTNKTSATIRFNEGSGDICLNRGPYYTSNSNYVIARITSLPELDDGEKIISAKFNFETTNGTSLFTSATDSPIIINAHKLKSINSNIVSYDSNILDYDSLTYNDNQYMSFDLTKTVNEWYDNGDSIDGFVLESFATAGSKTVSFKESTRKSTTPSLTFIYKDFKGTESNLSYHTIPVGHNAQASVSDYLGNLVINQSLYEGTGSRMPVTLTATYNSINYNAVFANGSPSGYGWQFSFNQYVRDASTALANKGYNYIYTDSDGTDHYLKKSDNSEEWYDEDGLGITLTKTDTNILIDNGSTTQIYELTSVGGKLLSEKDEYDNTITYTYTDGNVTKITDGSGRNFSIIYNTKTSGEKRVSKITRPDGKNIVFSYTSSEYDKIHYLYLHDGKVSRFYYDSSDLLTTIEYGYFESGSYKKQSSVNFTYNNGQVTKITEYGSDNTESNCLDIQYNNDNTTEFSDSYGNSITYTFDNSGNKISEFDLNDSSTTDDNTFVKNYITESFEHSALGTDSSYLKKVNGGRNGVNSKNGTISIDCSEPDAILGKCQYLGSNSIKVYNPVSSNNDAFFTGAYHQFNETSFNGKNMTFSAYVKVKDANQIYSGGPIGATLEIKCFDINNSTLIDVNSVGISGTEEWQRISVSAKIPESTSYIRVYCNMRYVSGTAWFDCLQFEEGNCANDFNALRNADFSNNDYWYTNDNNSISSQNSTVVLNGEAGVYNNAENISDSDNENEEAIQPSTYTQTVTETVPNDYIITYDDYGNGIKSEQGFVTRSVKKTYLDIPRNSDDNLDLEDNKPSISNPFTNNYIYQDVKIDRAGIKFNIVGEAQAKSVPLSNENRTFGLALNIYYKNNPIPETHYQEFNCNVDKKQIVNLSVTPEKDTIIIDRVAFAFVYGNNKNVMNIYNAMLNITAKNSPISLIDNNEIQNNYQTNNAETQEVEHLCINTEILSEEVDKSKPFMQTTTMYDSKGNYIVSETDEAGNVTNYQNDINGNVTSIIDGNDNLTSYNYDATYNVTKISNGNSEVNYSYDGVGHIATISHNDFLYSFAYDSYDRYTSTKINNEEVSNIVYPTSNSVKKIFSNSSIIEYLYDNNGNITNIRFDNGDEIDIIYNKKGLISSVSDSENNNYYFYYDFDGNITGEYHQDSSGNLVYWLSNNDNSMSEKININQEVKTYSKGSNDNTTLVEEDGIKTEISKDSFGRITEIDTSKNNENDFYSNYEYTNGNESNSTTNQVSKLTQKYKSNEIVNYEYTYDGNGNISSVKEDGTSLLQYDYDELNQLYFENDKVNHIYTHYLYDTAGNIIKVLKRKYNSYGVPTTTISENNYNYNDTEWKDKLTSFNGEVITYDEIGNPLSYRDGISFDWKDGRTLNSITNIKNNSTIQMKYNLNGLRSQKGNTKYYYDSNKNLIGMLQNNKTLFFYYDAFKNPTSVIYDGTLYYYVKNLQGDIVKIINQAGDVVVNYEYDAFGKILSIKDNEGNEIASDNNTNIGIINPLRYRSYIYDNETGLYYLESRYYDPVTGRFINADAFCDTKTGSPLSVNMFTYCGNNFLNYTDNSGHSGNEIWTSPKTCPVEKRAVQLGLINKSELQEFYYCGMYYGNDGYEHYTYNEGYDLINNGICYSIIEIYALRKTEKQWEDYSYQAWGWFEDTVNVGRIIINSFSELLTFLSDDFAAPFIQPYVTMISLAANILCTITGNPYEDNFVSYIAREKNNPNNIVDGNKYLILLKSTKSITIKYYNGGAFYHEQEVRLPY